MRVTADDLLLAAEWLDCNEGGLDESGPCHRVAEWLRAEASRRETRSVARNHGISMRVARRAIELASTKEAR